EDVLQSVFKSFFARHQGGQFDVANWDSLWNLLALLTVRKCADRIAYFHAACRDVRREKYVGVGAAQACTPDPTPSEAAILTETLTRFMADLEQADRDIVTLHLQGYTTPEISGHVHRSERSVCRVLERVRRRLRRLQEKEAQS